MRTVLQTRMGRVFDREISIAKPTFWESLTAEERRDSVDQQRSWGFKQQSAWNPAGRALEEWNNSIYPNLLRPLFKENTAALFRGAKKQCHYNITCWMIGDEWQSSHPAAIVLSGDPRVSKNGVKLIVRHGQLLKFGYRVYQYESNILPSMTTLLMDELQMTACLCGMPFAVGESNGGSSRKARLGGVVMLGDEPFALTVLHPFIKDRQTNDSDNDDTSNSSDGDGDVSGAEMNLHSQDSALDADMIYVPNSESHGRDLGAILHDSSYFSFNMDWALVKINKTPDVLIVNFATLDDKTVVPSKVSTVFPRGPVWAIVKSQAPISTTVSPAIQGLFIPNCGLQDAWASDMKPSRGDSGTWVIDPETESIFGIIVAGSELTETSYILPAQNVFSEIWERFPDMQFPLSGDAHTLLRAIQLNMPEIAKLAIDKSTSFDLNFSYMDDWNALALASAKGLAGLVSSLLHAGADPNLARSPSNSGPLHLATEGGFLQVMQILLDFGVNANSRSLSQGLTPLHIASKKGHEDAVKLLLKYGADLELVPDADLARRAELGVARELLFAYKKHPNISLISAAQSKCELVIRSFLGKEEDPNQSSYLSMAAKFDKSVQLVLYFGTCQALTLADLAESSFETAFLHFDYKTQDPTSALDSAAWAEYKMAIRRILNHDASPGLPIDATAWSSFETALCLLFGHFARPSDAVKSATREKYVNAVQLLLDHVAPGPSTESEITIQSIIQQLLDREANTSPGSSKLSESDDQELDKRSQQKGADPDLNNVHGTNQYESAKDSGKFEIIERSHRYPQHLMDFKLERTPESKAEEQFTTLHGQLPREQSNLGDNVPNSMRQTSSVMAGEKSSQARPPILRPYNFQSRSDSEESILSDSSVKYVQEKQTPDFDAMGDPVDPKGKRRRRERQVR